MFGHTLRMLRTTAGISLRSLAKKIDVSPAYLSQVELGKMPPPTCNRITKIAETIGIPVSLLIEMSHRPNPEIIMLLRGHRELNELIKLTQDIGLNSKDIVDLNSVMRKLGGTGFRKLLHYCTEHSSDFISTEDGNYRSRNPSLPADRTHFSELANPRLVFKSLEFIEKRGLLRYMVKEICHIFVSLDSEKTYKKIMAKENEDSSGFGNGVAMPHLFLEELDQTVISIARLPNGMDFHSVDRKPVFLVCLILSNPESYQSHLNLLAHFAQKFLYPNFMDDILKARTKKNILSLLFDGDNANKSNQIAQIH
ncbi:MAG: PTS sugar transporter subunit IIA [Candidatus Aminicenantes bacterium]